ncbi:15520_t:CDS:2 [Gigaspora margarita]|uniref:15520_t:CDS:1 n=1 Tax=Gigaspora margarita TaxID=4874 RepID=A0ABN7WFC3_GIGMA|nr:15520_t:CDS:2 [Gigaspora margarita]
MEDQGVVMLNSNFEPYAKNLNNARVVFGANLAVGKDNFEIIIRDRLTFVDKSMLIKEFIESSDLVSLILRPRRFGKSTNLSMLNRFFKIPYSQEENVICIKPVNANLRNILYVNSYKDFYETGE